MAEAFTRVADPDLSCDCWSWDCDCDQEPRQPGDVINYAGDIQSANPLLAYSCGLIQVTLEQAENAQRHGWRIVKRELTANYDRLCWIER